MRKNQLAFLVALSTLSCGDNTEGECVGLKKRTIEWPIVGGVDTKRSPFSLAPGSNLLVQDVRAERLGEWRRRDGFAQSAADTTPDGAAYFLGQLGASGAFINGQGGMADYLPSMASGRWSALASSARPQHRSRRPVFAADDNGGLFPPSVALARVGNITMVAAVYATAGVANMSIALFDVTGGAIRMLAPNLVGLAATRVAAAATPTKIVLFVSGLGTVNVYVIDPATGTMTGPTALHADAFSPNSLLVANYYGGATVTLAYSTNATDARLIEFNPTTGAIASDILMGILVNRALNLMDDPDASGVRFVALANSTNTVVRRYTDTGVLLTSDLVQAIPSTHITGVATENGNGWNVIYRTTTPNLRTQNKTGGAIGIAADFQGSATWGSSGTIDTRAWREAGSALWSVIIGCHSRVVNDPIDVWTEMQLPVGTSTASAIPVSSPVPGAGVESSATPTSDFSTLFPVIRVAAHKFAMALPVQVIYENNAGVVTKHFSVDYFEESYLTSADISANPTGKPVSYNQTALVPGGYLSFYDQGVLKPLGTRTPPRQPTIVPSVGAGALTPSQIYFYAIVIEQLNGDGDVWRSPPSVPISVTMSATQNTNTITSSSWGLEPGSFYRWVLFRTQGNGSDFRRLASKNFTPGADIVYVDLIADSAIKNAEFMYTTGEDPTMLTPPASMLALSDGRVWYVNREYGGEVGYSKRLRPGRLPEFTEDGNISSDLVDEYGDVTGIMGLDDKTVIGKEKAVYFVTGEGLDDAGSGNNYVVARIDGAIGPIAGSPMLSLGTEGYFVSTMGIMRVRNSVEFIGSAVDAFLHQPAINTPETVRSIVYIPKWDEVRFVTNASILVYNRTFQIWYRFKGGLSSGSPLLHSLVLNGRQVIVREDGKMFVEGDQSQLTDGANDFEGLLRSQWVVPAGPEGRFRLYLSRILATRTGGGSAILPRLDVFTDFNDTNPLAFEPVVDVEASTGIVRLEGRPHPTEAVVTSFSEQVTFPASDNTWRIEKWSAVVGIKGGYQRIASDGAMED